jgi:hypothetical protein
MMSMQRRFLLLFAATFLATSALPAMAAPRPAPSC